MFKKTGSEFGNYGVPSFLALDDNTPPSLSSSTYQQQLGGEGEGKTKQSTSHVFSSASQWDHLLKLVAAHHQNVQTRKAPSTP